MLSLQFDSSKSFLKLIIVIWYLGSNMSVWLVWIVQCLDYKRDDCELYSHSMRTKYLNSCFPSAALSLISVSCFSSFHDYILILNLYFYTRQIKINLYRANSKASASSFFSQCHFLYMYKTTIVCKRSFHLFFLVSMKKKWFVEN